MLAICPTCSEPVSPKNGDQFVKRIRNDEYGLHLYIHEDCTIPDNAVTETEWSKTMAQKVEVLLLDDLNPDRVADETVRFGLDGTQYEIDLATDHAEELREVMAKYVGAARKAFQSAPAKSKSSDGKAAKVREWARGQGIPVPDRGRIPAEITEKYDAVH